MSVTVETPRDSTAEALFIPDMSGSEVVLPPMQTVAPGVVYMPYVPKGESSDEVCSSQEIRLVKYYLEQMGLDCTLTLHRATHRVEQTHYLPDADNGIQPVVTYNHLASKFALFTLEGVGKPDVRQLFQPGQSGENKKTPDQEWDVSLVDTFHPWIYRRDSSNKPDLRLFSPESLYKSALLAEKLAGELVAFEETLPSDAHQKWQQLKEELRLAQEAERTVRHSKLKEHNFAALRAQMDAVQRKQDEISEHLATFCKAATPATLPTAVAGGSNTNTLPDVWPLLKEHFGNKQASNVDLQAAARMLAKLNALQQLDDYQHMHGADLLSPKARQERLTRPKRIAALQAAVAELLVPAVVQPVASAAPAQTAETIAVAQIPAAEPKPAQRLWQFSWPRIKMLSRFVPTWRKQTA